MDIKLVTPLTKEKVEGLKAGDRVLITGTIYTARDAAHKRLVELINSGRESEMPIDVKDAIIYHVGPTPAKPGKPIGSAGPTTSYRMDAYSPILIEKGLKGMIGKGKIGNNVIEEMKKNKAIYFGAIGGAAALIAESVKSCELIAYEDLGSEAIRKLEVENMPVVVVIDSEGNNLYELGQKNYLDSIK